MAKKRNVPEAELSPDPEGGAVSPWIPPQSKPSDAAKSSPTSKKGGTVPAGPSRWASMIVPPLVVIGSLVIYSVWGHRPEAPARELTEDLTPVVTTAVARAFSGPIEIAVEGVARPFRRVSVASEVAGRIRLKTEKCQEAMFVRKGDLLIELDPLDYEIAVRRNEQELKQTETALKEWEVERANVMALVELAQADEQLATRELERVRKLNQSGGSSQAAVDQSQRAQLVARNTLLSLQNQIRLLDARYERAISARDLQRVQLERAQRDLERTRIVAPCDGTIVSESVEQDGYSQAGATLLVINDTSAAEVICQLELSDMFWLWGTKRPESLASSDLSKLYEFPHWPVTIEFPVQDLLCRWDGEMVRYGGSGLDLTTRTIPCQIHVAQPLQGRLLRADGKPETNLVPPPLTVGMFVTVRAQVTPNAPLLEIPQDGLRTGEVVWAVRDGKLHIASVKIARRTGDRVLVYGPHDDSAEALRAGDKVITSPLALVQKGMELREVSNP